MKQPNFSNLCAVKFLVEFIYSTAGINEFLFACKEGVALRAYIHLNGFFAGTGNIFLAACAFDDCFFVFGMDTCLHSFYLAFFSCNA